MRRRLQFGAKLVAQLPVLLRVEDLGPILRISFGRNLQATFYLLKITTLYPGDRTTHKIQSYENAISHYCVPRII
jgi:hypothetical protein